MPKCLLRYQWVKLPRTHLPVGKGIMGYWAKLASRAAFRKGRAKYCGYTNDVMPGMWSGGVVGLKSILGVKSRTEALEIMNTLSRFGYIYMTFLGPDKLMHEELLYRLDISARHYYRLRTQAINIIALRLWSAPAGEVDSWLEVLSILENW